MNVKQVTIYQARFKISDNQLVIGGIKNKITIRGNRDGIAVDNLKQRVVFNDESIGNEGTLFIPFDRLNYPLFVNSDKDNRVIIVSENDQLTQLEFNDVVNSVDYFILIETSIVEEENEVNQYKLNHELFVFTDKVENEYSCLEYCLIFITECKLFHGEVYHLPEEIDYLYDYEYSETNFWNDFHWKNYELKLLLDLELSSYTTIDSIDNEIEKHKKEIGLIKDEALKKKKDEISLLEKSFL